MAVEEVELPWKRALSVDDQAHGLRTAPMTHVERGVVEQGRTAPHEDGAVLGPQAVDTHQGERRGEVEGLSTCAKAVDEAIAALGPLQGDVGALLQMEGEEPANQRLMKMYSLKIILHQKKTQTI